MTTTFHAYVAAQLAERLRQRRIVVWFDPRSEFATFVTAAVDGVPLAPPPTVEIGGVQTSLAWSSGSLYETRMNVESLVGGDDPPYAVLYVPGVKRPADGSVLLELEEAGTRWEPQLKQLARNALRTKFTDGVIDELLGRESITFTDIEVALQAEGASAPSILKTLLSGSSSENKLASWLAIESIDEQIQEKEASTELGKLIQSRLNLALEGETLSKWRRITARVALGLEFRSDLQGEPPAELAGLPSATADTVRNARAICIALRSEYPDQYELLADTAAADLQLASAKIDALQLGSVDTFRFEERALLDCCAALIRNGEFDRVLAITTERSTSHWLRHSVERQAQWEATRLAAELGAATLATSQALARPPATAGAWMERYATSWYRMDQAQRHLEAWLPKLAEDPDELTVTFVRTRYEELLEKMARGFADMLAKAGWDAEGVFHQTAIFDKVVKVQAGRVAYFLVDAMRYEMGAELASRLEQHAEVTLRHAAGVLPSITTTGMAALMPDASQSYGISDVGGKLVATIGGVALGDLKSRKAHLVARVPESIDFELGEVLSLTQKALAKKVGNASLVVVRSQDIDMLGESGSYAARTVMNTTIENLVQAVKKLAAIGIGVAVVASDHGHLYSAADKDESMRIDAPGGASVELHRRCWVGRGGATPAGCVRVPARSLGNDSDLDFVFPMGTGVFRSGGDLSFHHGGPTLQEMVIPVVTARSAMVAKAVQEAAVSVALEGIPSEITNRIFSAKLTFTSMFPPSIRAILQSDGRQVGTVAMALGASLDRNSGTVTVSAGDDATLGFVLDDDQVTNLRVIITDSETDAELYRSPSDIPVRLGVS